MLCVTWDGLVRKVEIAVVKDMKRALCARPVTDLMTLLEIEKWCTFAQ